MQKIRIFLCSAFLMALICILSVSVNAKWWDVNPFSDVNSNSWYYDAVRIVYENELFSGTSATSFSPSTKMTRAMLVQVLASADGYDSSDYAGSYFDDVPADKWYSSAVEWARINGVTAGTSETKFSPHLEITREQLATMLKRFAEYKGIVSGANADSMLAFEDLNEVSDWAENGINWAVENEIISGVEQGGTLYLKPKTSAKRSECAQMLSQFLYLNPIREINGNDISRYTIVYSDDEIDSVREAAFCLRDSIEYALGYQLPVVSDDADISEYEILVGTTNREEFGYITVDRDSFEHDHIVHWSVQGSYLVISGLDLSTKRGADVQVDGTFNAVYYFVEDILGLTHYSEGTNEYIYDGNAYPVVSLVDGYSCFKDGPYMRSRALITQNTLLSTGEGHYKYQYKSTLGGWIYGLDRKNELWFEPTPCLSDAENISSMISNADSLLSERKYVKRIYVVINDTSEYCKCEDCMEQYRTYGARSATLVTLSNEVAKMLADKHPDVEILLAAYTYTLKPPTNLKLEDNIRVEIVTIQNCTAHSYDDTECKFNKDLMNYACQWNEISSLGLTLWDHTGAPMATLMSFPDWDNMLRNVRLFADAGVTEVTLNGAPGDCENADFGPVRGRMYSIVYMDPYMSEEEFSYNLNKGLEFCYGDGYKEIRKYIDKVTELGDWNCHYLHGDTSAWYDLQDFVRYVDYFDQLWASAFEGATTEYQQRNISISYMSYLYLRQCAMYDEEMVNGSPEQQELYRGRNQLLYDTVVENNIVWGEHGLNNFSSSSSPDDWMIW